MNRFEKLIETQLPQQVQYGTVYVPYGTSTSTYSVEASSVTYVAFRDLAGEFHILKYPTRIYFVICILMELVLLGRGEIYR